MLVEPRSVALLSGPSRRNLHHGMRLGLDHAELARLVPGWGQMAPRAKAPEAPNGTDAPIGALWDWFGSLKQLVRREPTRLSVVFAFAEVGEVL